METKTVTVRDVEKKTWLEFRVLCLQQGENVGRLLTYIMKEAIKRADNERLIG